MPMSSNHAGLHVNEANKNESRRLTCAGRGFRSQTSKVTKEINAL